MELPPDFALASVKLQMENPGTGLARADWGLSRMEAQARCVYRETYLPQEALLRTQFSPSLEALGCLLRQTLYSAPRAQTF